MKPWLSRPRACADARLQSALIRGYYARADAATHGLLVTLGWEAG